MPCACVQVKVVVHGREIAGLHATIQDHKQDLMRLNVRAQCFDETLSQLPDSPPPPQPSRASRFLRWAVPIGAFLVAGAQLDRAVGGLLPDLEPYY